MRSVLLVLSLSIVLAVHASDLPEKEANRTSTEGSTLPTIITGKQINNAQFSRRAETPVDREARHTMICDSEFTRRDADPRSVDERSASESSVDREARRTMICGNPFARRDTNPRGVDGRNASEPSVDRDGELSANGTDSTKATNERPARSFNEFIIEGNGGSAGAVFRHVGKSVNVMRILPAASAAPITPDVQVAAAFQTMPTSGNGMNGLAGTPSLSSQGVLANPSASMAPAVMLDQTRPSSDASLPRIIQGAVINGATFTRRSVDGENGTKPDLERKSRDTFIRGSQINDGEFHRRDVDGVNGTKPDLERQSRHTMISGSQINDGRFFRRDADDVNGTKPDLERQSRHTMISGSQINDGRFFRRDADELANGNETSTQSP